MPHRDNLLRKSWGLDDKFVVGYSGNLGRAHEFNTVLDAAEALKVSSRYSISFLSVVVQSAQLWNRKLIDRGLSSVIFKPYQPRGQLSESLSLADVHLISLNPALEGLIVPSKFYGIAAAGRASIYIGDCCGEIPSVLQPCACECSVNVGDKVQLVREILRFADDQGLTEGQGTFVRQYFLKNFERNIAHAAFSEVLCE